MINSVFTNLIIKNIEQGDINRLKEREEKVKIIHV